ncbi:GATA transcription factor 4 [Hibiscus syriacus]|uniref:GATA transcription factor 4 n=1 Tax=Hibiscus syriacus TaxID=106335 RepID=A0A6A2WW95_HIBSY|nr:GATA transcription factor 1-like [Hibiscus syriacus]KAE8665601.1 GATA transcription factor 4 [Hibiscus syriacus]
MEAFDMSVYFDDKLLDFGSDAGGKDEDEHSFSKRNPNPSFPEFAEEELEWLSNKDAFPGVETSFVDVLENHQSPVSVLENSNSSSTSGSTTRNVVMFPVKARSKRVPKCRDMRNQENRWWLVKEKLKRTKGGRKCHHCGAEKTPQWRAGPFGPKTLCNACGVRYKSGRLVPEYRPASSPTFSDELHSNSHRKILEMRRQKQLGVSVINPMDKR